MKKFLKYETFQDAFVGLNEHILKNHEYKIPSRLGETWEISGLTYEVTDMKTFQFENENIGRLDYKYCSTFYDWLVSGSADYDDAAEAFKDYPGVKKWIVKPKHPDLPDNTCVFYGPRIVAQLDRVVKELTTNPNSRRGVVSILQESDLNLLDKPSVKQEFPCCDSGTFYIRDGKLNLHLHMRSENVGQVLKLDMYLWGRFTCFLAETYGLETGTFRSSMVSAHCFTKDEEYLTSLNTL